MLEAIDAASANLRAQARTDPLTGCANRLALCEDLAHATGSASRSGLDLALAAVDLDGLKRINDTRGHPAGDDALKALVARLREQLRDADTLYRTGGDEFVVIAPFTGIEGAAAMLERASEGDAPSFSWGVTTLRSVGGDAVANPELLMAAADADLYAKRRAARAKQEVEAPEPRRAWAGTQAGISAAARRSRAGLAAAVAAILAVARREQVALAGTRERVAATARRQRVALTSARSSLVGSMERHRVAFASAAAAVVLVAAAIGGLSALLGPGSSPSQGSRSASRLAPRDLMHHPAPTHFEQGQTPGQQGPGSSGLGEAPNPATSTPSSTGAGLSTSSVAAGAASTASPGAPVSTVSATTPTSGSVPATTGAGAPGSGTLPAAGAPSATRGAATPGAATTPAPPPASQTPESHADLLASFTSDLVRVAGGNSRRASKASSAHSHADVAEEGPFMFSSAQSGPGVSSQGAAPSAQPAIVPAPADDRVSGSDSSAPQSRTEPPGPPRPQGPGGPVGSSGQQGPPPQWSPPGGPGPGGGSGDFGEGDAGQGHADGHDHHGHDHH